LGRPGEAGTLEVTLSPASGALFLSVHASRRRPWVDEATVNLKTMLDEELGR
jgi:hypothetical protein